MSDSQNRDVPRPHADPTPDAVYEAMIPGRCYVVADLVADFSNHDVSRSTMHNRLDGLADDGRIKKRKHENGTVTFRRPCTDSDEEAEDSG